MFVLAASYRSMIWHAMVKQGISVYTLGECTLASIGQTGTLPAMLALLPEFLIPRALAHENETLSIVSICLRTFPGDPASS